MSSRSRKPPTSKSQIGGSSSDHEKHVTILDKMRRSLYKSLCWTANDSETNLNNRQNCVKSGKIQFSAEFKVPCQNEQRKTQNDEQNLEHVDSLDKWYNRGQKGVSTYSRRTNQTKNSYREGEGGQTDRKSTRRHLSWRQQATGDEKVLKSCSKYPIHAKDTDNHTLKKKESWVEEKYEPKCRYSHGRGDLDNKFDDYSKHVIANCCTGNHFRAASKKMDNNEYHNRKICHVKDKVDKEKLYHEIRKNLNKRKYHRYATSESSNEHGEQLKDDCKSYYDRKYPRNPTVFVSSRPFISRARSAAARDQRSDLDTLCRTCRDCPEDRRKKATSILNSEQRCKQVYVLSKEQCKSFKEKGYIKVNVRVKPNVSVSDFNITIKKDKSKSISRRPSYKCRKQ